MKLPVPQPLLPDDLMYQQAVDAMKRYDQAKMDGEPEALVERLRLKAEYAFQTITDYQVEALGGQSPTRH